MIRGGVEGGGTPSSGSQIHPSEFTLPAANYPNHSLIKTNSHK